MTEIGTLNVTTPNDREVVVSRVFDAPRRLVWEAWTKPEYLQRWLLGPAGWTLPVCEIDLRAGGPYRYVWRKANGKEMEIHGIFTEVAPPDRLVHTEAWGGDWPETLNTHVFTEDNNRTTVTLTMLFPSLEARDAAIKTGMNDGVAVSYDRLDEVLRTMV